MNLSMCTTVEAFFKVPADFDPNAWRSMLSCGGRAARPARAAVTPTAGAVYPAGQTGSAGWVMFGWSNERWWRGSS
jgi:hypothetical protein